MNVPAISLDTYGSLKRGGSIMWRNAKLSVMGDSFLMEGKSGTHALLICATDRARLTAHWQIFAAHAANA